jgi:hypothetical protein
MAIIAKIPFAQGTIVNQELEATINAKRFTLRLEHNSAGFFVFRATCNNIIYCNQKLTDVVVKGRDPEIYITEFLILPYSLDPETLEIWIVTVQQLFDEWLKA